MTERHEAELLIELIHAQELVKRFGELLALPSGTLELEGRALVEEAKTAVAKVSEQSRAAQAEMMAALTDAGVKSTAVDIDIEGKQFHAFELVVSPLDVSRSIAVAAESGFPLAGSFSSGACEALRRIADQIDLLRPDAHGMRLRLRWRDRKSVRNRFYPTVVDVTLVSLPKSLWPAYFLIKPLSFLANRLVSRSLSERTGLVTAGSNLSTPHALIQPLLDFAEVGREDLLFDLGCGDGRIVCAAAKSRGCRAIGVEKNPFMAKLAVERANRDGLRGLVEIRNAEAQVGEISGSTVVFAFLPTSALEQLVPGILDALEPGARLVVHEQARLPSVLRPDKSLPIFARSGGLTVAHLWTREEVPAS